VRKENLAKEYAARAATNRGIKVAGIVTIKEFSIALLRGAPAVLPTQTS